MIMKPPVVMEKLSQQSKDLLMAKDDKLTKNG